MTLEELKNLADKLDKKGEFDAANVCDFVISKYATEFDEPTFPSDSRYETGGKEAEVIELHDEPSDEGDTTDNLIATRMLVFIESIIDGEFTDLDEVIYEAKRTMSDVNHLNKASQPPQPPTPKLPPNIIDFPKKK